LYETLLGAKLGSDSPYAFPTTEKVKVAKGSTNINVLWTATVTAAQKLKNPKVQKVELGETTWE
jgi:hypothetical protein